MCITFAVIRPQELQTSPCTKVAALHAMSCRGSVLHTGKVILKALPRPRAPEYAPGVRIAAVLHPFLHPTPQADVNRVLMHFVNYHIRIGFAQVVQYTQARPSSRVPTY